MVPGGQGFNLWSSHTKDSKKWYWMLPCKHYKGKVEQSREWSSYPSLHLDVVGIEKGVFRSPSTKVANFTLLYYKDGVGIK